MSAVSWFLQIPPNPHSKTTSTSTMAMLSSLLTRSPSSPSGNNQPRQEPTRTVGGNKSRLKPSRTVGDNKPRQKPPRTVSWDPTVEVGRRTFKSVTWSENVEVFIVPARGCRSDDYDLTSKLAPFMRRSDDPKKASKAPEPEQDTSMELLVARVHESK